MLYHANTLLKYILLCIAMTAFFIQSCIIQIPARISPKEINRPIITIWVHGSIFFYHRYLLWIKRSMRQWLHTSDHISTQLQTLRPLCSLHPKSHLYTIATTIAQENPSLYPLEHFYIFRWSGKLNRKDLTTAANQLYVSLVKLQNKYQKKYSVRPFIRIMSHSNGCNVALSLAEEYQSTDTITIDELILLACPIQGQSIRHIESPLFQTIYHLFSESDWLQTCAIQIDKNNRPERSKRIFPIHKKLRQIDIKLNNQKLWHYQFRTLSFLKKVAAIIQSVDYIFSTQSDAYTYIWKFNRPEHI